MPWRMARKRKHGLPLVETARPRMCFLGRTGSGKTTLLNSFIERRILPQSSNARAVTSTVTECVQAAKPRSKTEAVSFHRNGFR